MMLKLLHRLRGQVRVRVLSHFPERALNACSARGIAFWDLRRESAEAFSCTVSRQDYGALRKAAEDANCRVETVKKEGAPYFLRRFRRRGALVIGLIACAAALFLGSFFVWDFEVTGNETVPTEKILRVLEENGVRRGRFGLSLDGEEIRNRVLLDLPELSFLTVNVSGCRAQVQVRERIPKPKIADQRAACNVVSHRAGVVLEVRTLTGTAAVARGSSVTRGQLLISGVRDTETFGSRLLPACGSVRGRTWYRFQANLPASVPVKRPTGREKTGISLIFGLHRIKLFSNSSIAGAQYDKITERRQITLCGIPLPVAVERERFSFYETEEEKLSAESAKRRMETVLEETLHGAVDGWGEILKRDVSVRDRGDLLTVTLTAECEEELGVTAPIYEAKEPDGASG